MSLEEATPLQVDRPKLSRAIARALSCQQVQADIGPASTTQIGSWSSASVPVFLTIQNDRRDFHLAAAHLAATLRQKFILLSPTKSLLTAETQQILTTAGAAIFDLASTITITPNGTLHPVTTPGELFINFMPQPKETDQSVAERAFALIRQLDMEPDEKPPSALTVFRLYCIDELTARQIAIKCHCSKATVLNRLAAIHHKTGVDPQSFRRLSPHIAKIEDQLSDSRASHIHRHSSFESEDPERSG